jgi:hypothetical protein
VEIIKIKNVSGVNKNIRFATKDVLLANNGTLLITDEILAGNEDIIFGINKGVFDVINPTDGYIIADTVSQAMDISEEDTYTITIPAGEEWVLASASLSTSAGTASLKLDGKTVTSGADDDPVVTVNATTFGQSFKVADKIEVIQAAADGTFTLVLKGTKIGSFK